MKKILLSVLSVSVLSMGVNAQTHSDLSGNKPSTSGDGYYYNFSGSDLNNCSPAWLNYLGAAQFSWSFSNGIATLTKAPTGSDYWTNGKFNSGDCNILSADNPKIDLSGGNFTVKIHAKAIGSDAEMWVSVNKTVANAFALAKDNKSQVVTPAAFVTYTFNFDIANDKNQLDNFSDVEGLSLGLAAGKSIEIDWIEVGDGVHGTSVNELSTLSNFTIFPSPATSEVNLTFTAQEATTVTLTDITGRVMVSEQASAGSVSKTYNVSGFAQGLYFVTISGANGQTTEKFMVK